MSVNERNGQMGFAECQNSSMPPTAENHLKIAVLFTEMALPSYRRRPRNHVIGYYTSKKICFLSS